MALPMVGGSNEQSPLEKGIWWKTCTHQHARSPPVPQVPRAAAAAAARGGAAGDCSAHSVCSALAKERPATPPAVLVQVSETPLASISSFVRLTAAAAAVYALLHGYVTLYYDGSEVCKPARHAMPVGWREPLDPALYLPACKRKRCCWQGLYYLRPEWLKPAALVDAVKRYPGAEWVVSLDTDAVPRYAGWAVSQAADWALRHSFRKGGGWGLQSVGPPEDPSSVAAIIAREAYAAMYGNATDPAYTTVAAQKRFNTGVVLLRGGGKGRGLAERWWASRDSDCLARCSGYERRCLKCTRANRGMWDCQRRGMYRLWDQRDQSALGHHVYPHLPKDLQIAEVPHIFINGHSGLFFAHFYNERWRDEHVLDWAAEHLARHAAAASATVCAAEKTPPCARPEVYETGDGAAQKCARGVWGTEWAAAAAAHIQSVTLRWGNETNIDWRCFRDLNDLVAAEQITGKRRSGGGRRARR